MHGPNRFIRRETATISTTSGRSIPPEVLLSGIRRLRLLAFVLLGLFIVSMIVTQVLPRIGFPRVPWVTDDESMAFFCRIGEIQIIAMVVATAMIAVTYWKGLQPQQILNIGLGFQVFGALLFSLTDYSIPWPLFHGPVGLPRTFLWLATFPLIPAGYRRAGLTALAAAATGPVAMAITAATGQRVPSPITAFFFYLPLFIGAGLVTVVTGVIHGLARDVHRVRKLGSYRLVKKLAEGGMGEVWEARHGSLIRPAAIKLIRPDVLGQKSQEEMGSILRRFIREAQSTACMTSPHTVALYDFGRTGDGTIYYVMELLGGLDLEQLVRRHGPLPAARVMHILRQACASLGEAHRNGLVHRDIKPANMQLTVVGGEFDFLKVLDFGLAKRTNDGAGPLITAEHVITGTPAYLSPEGAAGGRSVDERSDLYSLGCVAYWLLTGKLVFQEETPMAMVLAHVKNVPVPPSQRTELPIPAELDRLILDLIAKDPAERPANAQEVVRRLDAVPLAEAWTQERAQKWWLAHMPQDANRSLHTASCEARQAEVHIEQSTPEVEVSMLMAK